MADTDDTRVPDAGTPAVPLPDFRPSAEQRYVITDRELRRFADDLRYRTAFYSTGSACFAFALSIWLGARIDTGEWGAWLPYDPELLAASAVPVLVAVAAGFYALGAAFGLRARRLLTAVRARPR